MIESWKLSLRLDSNFVGTVFVDMRGLVLVWIYKEVVLAEIEITNIMSEAHELHERGRLTEAETLYQSVLEANPDHAPAIHLLGVIAHQRGDHALAITMIDRAIGLDDKDPAFYSNLGHACLRLEQFERAEWAFRLALQLNDRIVGIHNGLGKLYERKRDYTRALAHYEISKQLDPHVASVYVRIANLLSCRGDAEESIGTLKQAIQIDNTCVPAIVNLGNAYNAAGKYGLAIDCYQTAIRIDPGIVNAHIGLGIALRKESRFVEAGQALQKAIEIEPGNARAHDQCARVAQDGRDLLGAISSYRRAMELGRLSIDSYYQLCVCFRCLCRPDAVDDLLESLPSSLPLMPRMLFRYNQLVTMPVVYQDVDHIDKFRRKLCCRIDEMVESQVKFKPSELTGVPFYIAYQGLNDRDVQMKLSVLYDMPGETRVVGNQLNRPSNRRMRIGFISSLFYAHTIAWLNRGIIEELDRGKFEVFVFFVGKKKDSVSNAISDSADYSTVLPGDIASAVEVIRGKGLDVLYFTDVGMNSDSGAIARHRMAPVQCVSWGHPVTTGLPTMDYFISSDLLEVEEAEEHYSETLVRLSTLPCYYLPLGGGSGNWVRSDFGLPDDRHVYLSPQSIFKFHPEFDLAIAEILRSDPDGGVYLVEALYPEWGRQLRARFERVMPDVVDRIHFLPRMSYYRFHGLMAVADVILDPFHFGGGNTTYEALSVGTPVVTRPSRFMRGRVTQGCYARMGFTDCVVPTLDAYVDLAVRLGTDPDYRRSIVAKIEWGRHRVLEDSDAISELEAFFESAVLSAFESSNEAAR